MTTKIGTPMSRRARKKMMNSSVVMGVCRSRGLSWLVNPLGFSLACYHYDRRCQVSGFSRQKTEVRWSDISSIFLSVFCRLTSVLRFLTPETLKSGQNQNFSFKRDHVLSTRLPPRWLYIFPISANTSIRNLSVINPKAIGMMSSGTHTGRFKKVVLPI